MHVTIAGDNSDTHTGGNTISDIDAIAVPVSHTHPNPGAHARAHADAERQRIAKCHTVESAVHGTFAVHVGITLDGTHDTCALRDSPAD